jgi:hypothetical protein
MLLMLEDDADRIRRFRAVLRRLDCDLRLLIWRNAWTMIREVAGYLPQARMISLDHDLEPEEGETTDPGTGWDVAQHLAMQPPVCPVLIHTSNGERATWMMGEFELEGWEYHRVPPLGDDWIERDWRRVVCRVLRRGY